MTSYFIRRLLLTIPTFLGITLVVFVITRFVPGGPIERMISQMKHGSGDMASASRDESRQALSEEQLQQLKEFYGFDKPVYLAYWDWLTKLLRFDLGISSRYSDPVWETIRARLPISIFFGIFSLILTYLVCIPLGILKALYHRQAFDFLSSLLVFIGYAVPAFVIGIILIVVFATRLDWFPTGGFVGDNFSDLSFVEKIYDLLHHTTLPLLTYVAGSFAVMTFLMKNALLENIASDYVRTAMAKGLSFRLAVFKHALRNSLIPLATNFGENLSLVLSGSFLVESIFNINGIGLLGYESIVERDYPVVLGILVISSLLQLMGNIVSDFCVAFVDPRVKYS